MIKLCHSGCRATHKQVIVAAIHFYFQGNHAELRWFCWIGSDERYCQIYIAEHDLPVMESILGKFEQFLRLLVIFKIILEVSGMDY